MVRIPPVDRGIQKAVLRGKIGSSRRPIASVLFQKRRANDSLAIATPADAATSDAVKSRPARIGIPARRK
jgi:hypothetical protein